MPAPNKKKDKAAASPEASVCANCGVQEGQHGATLSKCRKCKATLYCSRDCQRAHWDAGHKGQCVRPEDRAPEKAPLASGGGGDEDECPICLEPLVKGSALTLPCTNCFHPGCVEGLRSYEIKQVCPMCREELPPGPEQLFEEAGRFFFPFNSRVDRGEASWGSLTAAQQRTMDEVVQKWTLAAEQGNAGTQFNLGVMHENGQGVTQNFKEALRWYTKAAEQGNVMAQSKLGAVVHESSEARKCHGAV